MSGLVGIPKDQLSHFTAHLVPWLERKGGLAFEFDLFEILSYM